jgi:tetratricopeptide (TPR) repeat protein
MKARYFIIFVLLIAIIPGISAQECVIEYLDGILEIHQNNTWVEAEQGDILPITAILKTHDNTLVELSLDNQLYVISAEGTYSLETVVLNNEDTLSWNIGSVLGHKLAIIIEDEVTQHEGSMGVRGDETIGPDKIDWMESSEFVVWEGQKLINKGKYREALEYFQDAFENAFSDNEKNEYLYYIGYCYVLIGNKTLALITLSQVEIQEDASYYGQFVLLKGRLLTESFSYQKAIDLTDEYLKKFPDGDNAQAVNFLSAFCHKKMNNIGKAIERLKRAYEIDPGTPIGIEAIKQIAELKNNKE